MLDLAPTVAAVFPGAAAESDVALEPALPHPPAATAASSAHAPRRSLDPAAALTTFASAIHNPPMSAAGDAPRMSLPSDLGSATLLVVALCDDACLRRNRLAADTGRNGRRAERPRLARRKDRSGTAPSYASAEVQQPRRPSRSALLWHLNARRHRAAEFAGALIDREARERRRREQFWKLAGHYASAITVPDRFGKSITLNTADPVISRLTFVMGVFAPGASDHFTAALADHGFEPEQIVDVGANIGTSTWELLGVPARERRLHRAASGQLPAAAPNRGRQRARRSRPDRQRSGRGR